MDLVALLIAAVALAVTQLMEGGFTSHMIVRLALMVALPTAYIVIKGRRLSEYMIGWGNVKTGLKYSAALILVALPIMYYGAGLSEFQDYYPLWKPASESPWNFILFESYVLALMFSCEFFFRGYLLTTLNNSSRFGNIMHALIYMVAHVGKPWIEVFYSFGAGWVFGEVDTRCKSILPSLMMHYISSVIFDLMILYRAGIL